MYANIEASHIPSPAFSPERNCVLQNTMTRTDSTPSLTPCHTGPLHFKIRTIQGATVSANTALMSKGGSEDRVYVYTGSHSDMRTRAISLALSCVTMQTCMRCMHY